MPSAPDLDEWIAELKSSDPITYEDAYWGPRPTGPAVIPRLISEMHNASDALTRGIFIEVLGEMGNADVVPELVPELDHPEATVRSWAMTALQTIGGDAAERALQRHRVEYPGDFV